MRTTETAHVGPPRASTTAAHVTRRRVMGGLGALAALPAMLTGTQGAAATVAGSIRPARSQRTTSDGLDRSKLRFIDVHGIRTRYHEDGSGEALVLVHGGQFGDFNSLDCWSLNLPVLAQNFHVYALDKLGQGFTDNVAEDDNYTFEALLQHTIDFLDAVGVTAAHLVGHSRGGHLVACIALRRPDLVKTLVIVDSSTLAPEDPRYPMRAFYVDLARRTPQGLPTPEIVRMEPDAQAFSKDQVTDDLLARMYEIAQLPKIQDAATRMRAVSDNLWLPSLTRWREEALRQIDERGLPAPTLLIWGYNDRAAPVPVGLPLFERIWAKTARAELHILYGSGHYSFRERPDAFNRLLSEFCLSHTA